MKKAKEGDVVKVHYTGKLNDGNVFDSSKDREPLQFQLGKGQMIPGFEKAVLGMAVGDNTTATLPPTEAYGEARQDLIFPINKTDIPAEMKVEVGMPLQAQTDNGQAVQVTVKEIKANEIILDANHFLAGKELIFDIELLEIDSAD